MGKVAFRKKSEGLYQMYQDHGEKEIILAGRSVTVNMHPRGGCDSWFDSSRPDNKPKRPPLKWSFG